MRSSIAKVSLLLMLMTLLSFLFSRLIPPKIITIEAEPKRVMSVSVCEEVIKHQEDALLSADPVEIYEGTPAKVDFSRDPWYKTYYTMITTQVDEGPNFAGHYTFASWGCGTECLNYVIVDTITGKIAYIPPEKLHRQYPSYNVKSNIIVMNPKEDYRDLIGKTLEEIIVNEQFSSASWSREYYEFIDDGVGEAWLPKVCGENVLDGIVAY